MNKTEFITEIASKAELSKKQAEAAYDAMLGTIVETLKAGEKIQHDSVNQKKFFKVWQWQKV